MPLTRRQRITSQTSNVVFAANEATAIANALDGDPGNTVAVSNPFPFWPSINKYDNDNNNPFNAVSNPVYVWSETPADPGESFGFAVRSNSIPLSLALGNEYLIALAVVSDNAHQVTISAYNAATLGLIATQTNLNFSLADGPLATGTTELSPPFGWQKVRFYTIPANLGVAVGVSLDIFFVISFTAVNYSSNGPDNPAGLAFIADIYQSTLV
ncbi:hypothetical protein [Paenibacillus montanisoli]|uniref:Uncharacterized protein n=1 Tax=Paenibacillus montanisoli TaxID=2081970 RepID=A0A328U9D0_9BACL|nr:hypothetical protein [Paenibacillus montanisoli]RAP76804.1 hypothetical protein DL346_15820 [Paenibacillus montanisoli]